MKKLIALTLSFLLVMSLCACGTESHVPTQPQTPVEPTGTTETPTEPTPTEPAPTQPAPTQPAPTEPSTEPTEETQKPVSLYQRWIDRMTGEWFALDSDKNPSKSCKVNSDGTIDIGGVVYKIKMTTLESWDWAKLSFLQDETKVYEGRVDLEEDGSIAMIIEKVGKFYLLAQYDVITLTAENWLDYFEQGTYVNIHKNDFKEVDYMDVYIYYSVKDEYASTSSALSSAAIEYTHKVDRRTITADPENGTFTVGDVIRENEPNSEMKSMSNITVSNDSSKLFGFNFYMFRLTDFEEGYTREYTYYTFDQVLRITGTLYIYNGNAK